MNKRSVAKNVATRAVIWKLARAMPVLGIVVSAFYLARRIRTKGAMRGSVDTALDMTPFVGRLKAIYELFAGDVIPPKRTAPTAVTPEATVMA